MNRRRLLRLLGAGALILPGGSATTLRAFAEAAPPFDHAGLVEDFLEGFLRPATARFAAAAMGLDEAARAQCARPDDAGLGATTRAAFSSAALAYAPLDIVRFGPSHEAARPERLLLYPDPKGLVRRQVEKELAARAPSVLDAASLHGKSVALQGLPALEILLFAAPAGLPAEETQFRCGFAAAIAANIRRIAGDLDRDWRDESGFARLMRTPSADNPAYLDANEVTLGIAQTFVNGIEQIRDSRLAGPIGLRAVDKAPTPGILETAGLTLPYIVAGLEGLGALYGDGGIEKRVTTADHGIARLIGEEIETAAAAVRRAGTDLDAARKGEGRRAIIAAGFPLRNAQQLAAELITQAAGVTVGFNAGDGD
ncbi:MAG: imelysin family protein [Hyphomicrobiaceae bacterium]